MDDFDNAVLTQIAAPGPLDTNGDPGTPVPVWTGRAPGYLKRVRRSVLANGVQVRINVDIFTILSSVGAPPLEVAGADWEAHTVVIDDMRTGTVVTRRFTVNGMENRVGGTIVDSLRLELVGDSAP